MSTFEKNMDSICKSYNNILNKFEITYNFNNTENNNILIDINYDEQYIRSEHNKIVDIKQCINEILYYQLLNPDTPENKLYKEEDIINFIIKTLEKYQLTTGGEMIEDTEWTVETNSSKRFKIKENESILYNTIINKDNKTKLFMKNLMKYLKKYIDEDIFFIDYKIINDELIDLYFIIIFIKKIENIKI